MRVFERTRQARTTSTVAEVDAALRRVAPWRNVPSDVAAEVLQCIRAAVDLDEQPEAVGKFLDDAVQRTQDGLVVEHRWLVDQLLDVRLAVA